MMRKPILIILLLFCVFIAKAQQVGTLNTAVVELAETDSVYERPEVPADFPGGMKSFYIYVAQNIRYPREAREKLEKGRVFLNFIVGKSGKISEVKVVRGASKSLNEEAERIIKESPVWIPAQQGGKAVRSLKTIPITFTL